MGKIEATKSVGSVDVVERVTTLSVVQRCEGSRQGHTLEEVCSMRTLISPHAVESCQ